MKWIEAINKELQALIDLNTFEYVPRVTASNVIDSRYVFRIKEDDNGHPIKYKARLCPRGFKQRSGVDYNDIFSPVARYISIRILLSIVAVNDFDIDNMDVDTAFPNATLDENIYMERPDGLEKIAGMVVKLNKALYGLKQSPRQWNLLIHQYLLSINFKQTVEDACIYVLNDDDGELVYVCLYVDDILVAAKHRRAIDMIKQKIKDKFKCKNMGPCIHFLGFKLTRNRVNKTILINNVHMIDKLLFKFDNNSTKVSHIPIEPNKQFTKPPTTDIIKDVPYRELVGSLLYIMMVFRPDLSYVTNILSRFLDCPTSELWKTAIKTIQYLRATKELGIMFGHINHKYANKLLVFSDSDWGSDHDTGRSTSGYVIMFNGGPISWSTKLQTTAALSTTDAEYYSLTFTLTEVLWIRQLLLDMKCPQSTPTVMYEDNKGAIDLANHPGYHRRTKHINIRYHFIRYFISNGEIIVLYIPTKRQLAYPFTKGVPRPEFTSSRIQYTGYVELAEDYYMKSK